MVGLVLQQRRNSVFGYRRWREQQQRSETEESAPVVLMDVVLLEGSELHHGASDSDPAFLHKTFNVTQAATSPVCVCVCPAADQSIT